MTDNKKKTVGVVCSTFRNPDKNNLARLYGVVSLFDQMLKQDFDGDIKIVLVDDSPQPHPFYTAIADTYKDRVAYLHVPTREDASASHFIPSNAQLAAGYRLDLIERLRDGGQVLKAELKIIDGDFSLTSNEWDQVIGRAVGDYADAADVAFLRTPVMATGDAVFWRDRIREMRGFARFLPFEEDYPIQINIFPQMFQDRPTIGMKKNAGVEALLKNFGDVDALVFCDDDDHHAPDYVRKSVAALEGNGFTRMTRYITHVLNDDPAKAAWGEYHLPVQKDANGYWILPPGQAQRTIICAGPDGNTFEREMGDSFSRLVTMAWPLISHEGALHTYSPDTWKQSVKAFGGVPPVSFSEDIIYFRMLKDSLGAAFKSAATPVDEPSFIRVADGNNASMIYWMKNIAPAQVPQWAQDALAPLNAARAVPDADHDAIMKKLAASYVETGRIDISLIRKEAPAVKKPPVKKPSEKKPSGPSL